MYSGFTGRHHGTRAKLTPMGPASACTRSARATTSAAGTVGARRRIASANCLRKREIYRQPSADFEPRTAAKKLSREARSGALASLMQGSGDPYASLVNVATSADGSPLLLISRL